MAPAGYPPTTPPGAYAQAPPGGYIQPTPAAYPTAYTAPAKTRGALFWMGAGIILVAGVLVLVSAFMPWLTGPRGFISFSGWDAVRKSSGAEVFFSYNSGSPTFTGLCSLIAGGIIALVGLLMLIFRSKGVGVIAIIFSIIALGMAITNLSTFLRTEMISVGMGMYVFLIFSFLGLVGGGLAMAG